MLEVLVCITLVILASAFFFEKLSNLIRQLHTLKPKGLLEPGKSISLNLVLSSRDKKIEACGLNTNFSQKDNEIK